MWAMMYAQQSYLNRDYSVLEQKGRHAIVSYFQTDYSIVWFCHDVWHWHVFAEFWHRLLHWLKTPCLMPCTIWVSHVSTTWYEVLTTWVSHVYHLVSHACHICITCLPYGYHMLVPHGIMCAPHRYYMYITWYHVHAHLKYIKWVSHVYHTVSHAHHICITCVPYGYHMLVPHGIVCAPHRYYMYITWYHVHAHLKYITWVLHVYHMISHAHHICITCLPYETCSHIMSDKSPGN